MAAYRNSREHLFEELRRLDLVLDLAVARQRRDPAAAGFNEFRGLFISEGEVDSLLAGDDGAAAGRPPEEDEESSKLLEAVARAERRVAETVAESARQGVSLALE